MTKPMTTTPTKPSVPKLGRECFAVADTISDLAHAGGSVAAVHSALLALVAGILDEQHAAGRGEPKMVLGGFGAPGYGMQPATVAGEPQEDCSDCHVVDGCKTAHELRGHLDEYAARLNKVAAERDEAQSAYLRSQAQTDDYERALEAERRHTALLTQALAEARSQLASEQAAHAVTMYERDRLLKYYGPAPTEPASPSEPAPVAPTDLCRCSWPAPPLGPRHSVECPLFRAAAPVAEPGREIVVGSVWSAGAYRVRVTGLDENYVHYRVEADTMTGQGTCSRGHFVKVHTWVSDPDGASDASEGSGP